MAVKNAGVIVAATYVGLENQDGNEDSGGGPENAAVARKRSRKEKGKAKASADYVFDDDDVNMPLPTPESNAAAGPSHSGIDTSNAENTDVLHMSESSDDDADEDDEDDDDKLIASTMEDMEQRAENTAPSFGTLTLRRHAFLRRLHRDETYIELVTAYIERQVCMIHATHGSLI